MCDEVRRHNGWGRVGTVVCWGGAVCYWVWFAVGDSGTWAVSTLVGIAIGVCVVLFLWGGSRLLGGNVEVQGGWSGYYMFVWIDVVYVICVCCLCSVCECSV